MNLKHFIARAKGSGDLSAEQLTGEDFRKLLNSVNMGSVKADAIRFISDSSKVGYEIFS